MKITYLSLLIACAAALLSLFQSEKYQNSTQTLSHQLLRLEDDLKSKIEELETHTKTLEHAKNTSLPLNTQQWRRFEIESLLTLAQTQYESTSSLGSVLILLNHAEKKLKTLEDPHLKPLEVALSQDLKILGEVQLIDKQTRYQQIDYLTQQIASLSFQGRSIAPQNSQGLSQTTPESLSPNTAFSWQTACSDGLKHLKELIKIQRHTKPIEPILSNEEQGLIQQQMHFLLQQSRLAVLMSDQTLYNQTLQMILSNLEHYYTHVKNIESIKKSLLILSQQSIVNQLPPLTYINQLSLLRPEP